MNICHHMLTSSTQLQNRSFHVVERSRTSTKCQKKKNARAKRAKILFFIVKYANLWGFCCRRRRGCVSSLITKGRDPFNQNSNRSDREKRTTSRGGPVFSKLFRLDRTDPLSFGPKFPKILVEWIAPKVPTTMRSLSGKSFILCLCMKTIRTKLAKVHFTIL